MHAPRSHLHPRAGTISGPSAEECGRVVLCADAHRHRLKHAFDGTVGKKHLTPCPPWRASNVGVCGSLADGYPEPKTLGGKLLLVAAVRRDPADSLLLLRGVWRMRDLAVPGWDSRCGGPSCGELSGGNWIAGVSSARPLLRGIALRICCARPLAVWRRPVSYSASFARWPREHALSIR